MTKHFSVLLSVYQEEKPEYLNAALRSIWDEQCLKPDQIVLVEDGPLTAELEETISSCKAKLGDVLCIVPLENNVGLAAALNAGLLHCDHDLVARMDTNDVSLTERFALQVNFMLANPNIAVCSGQIDEWDEHMHQRIGTRQVPLTHDEIFRMARSRNPINHPAVIYRKSAVLAAGGYPQIYPEEYPLWCLMLMRGDKFANLDQCLLRMRTGQDFFARRGREFLRGELEILKLQRQISMISRYEYARNYVIRCVVRLSPVWLKRFLYRHVRG